ncbi:MAG: cytochrome c-type biosis protein CcmH [Gammaproteobacteria bacterium]|nr:cytochrome c-type biosis protein CcmH [Gammaproteobacteria bacterium]
MSPRDSFWFLAGALVAVAIMVTVRAWLRERPALSEGAAGRSAIPSFAVPIAAALALLGVALGIYFLLGSPDSIASSHAVAATQSSQQMPAGQPSATAGSLDDVTNKLAARLAAQGGSDNDWKLLAESYEYMGRTEEAKAAKAHIASASPVAAADAPTQVTGDQIAASQVSAGQISASQISDMADSLDIPSTATQGNAEISGTVEITSRLARLAANGATLFIYAKQPNAPGPPLAVLRVRAEHWPVTFTLNDANAMVPGRNLSNAKAVQIEARISKNGDALPQSGDLVGTVTSVNPRDGHPVKISIDREIG